MIIKFSHIRLLVQGCKFFFKFYNEKFGLELDFGKPLIIFLLSFINGIFVGCDFTQNYEYTIVNETSNDVVIKTVFNQSDNRIRFKDSSYIVKSREKLTFIQEYGLCGRGYIPEDIYISEDTIPPVSKFDILIQDTIQSKLRLRKYWEFSAIKQIGTYKLRVTDSIR